MLTTDAETDDAFMVENAVSNPRTATNTLYGAAKCLTCDTLAIPIPCRFSNRVILTDCPKKRRFFFCQTKLSLSGGFCHQDDLSPPRSVGRSHPPQGPLLTQNFPTGLPTTHKLSLSLSLSLTPQDDVMKNFRVRGEGGREEVVRLLVGCERVRESERESGVEAW